MFKQTLAASLLLASNAVAQEADIGTPPETANTDTTGQCVLTAYDNRGIDTEVVPNTSSAEQCLHLAFVNAQELYTSSSVLFIPYNAEASTKGFHCDYSDRRDRAICRELELPELSK